MIKAEPSSTSGSSARSTTIRAAAPPDALDADHIRVHLCANAQYAVDDSNRVIADALEASDLVEVEGGYVVADDV